MKSEEEMSGKKQSLKIVVFLLLVLIIGLLVGIIILLVEKDEDSSSDTSSQTLSQCSRDIQNNVDISENLFSELTPQEIRRIREYMRQSENLVNFSNRRDGERAIFFIDKKQPNKDEAINYLDNNGPKPVRKAYVFVADSNVEVTRYEVWPADNPTNYRIANFNDRENPIRTNTAPLFTLDGLVRLRTLAFRAYRVLLPLFRETYEDFRNFTSLFANVIAGIDLTVDFLSKINETGRFVGGYYEKRNNGYREDIYKYTLIYYLYDISSQNTSDWNIYKVLYDNIPYDSAEQLNEAFQNGTLQVKNVPSKDRTQIEKETLFRNVRKTNVKLNSEPVVYLKNGHRFTVNGRSIKYFDWSFEYSLSGISGPGVFDVKFQNKRIAYEVSLQDVALMHLVDGPFYSSGNVLLSLFSLGVGPSLVRGVDCPEQAMYLNSFRNGYFDDLRTIEGSICIFETVNTIPLRRDTKFAAFTRTQFAGMNDNMLVIRFTHGMTGFPTGFIFDYIFHQNGVIEVKATPNGRPPVDSYDDNSTVENMKIGDRLRSMITNDYLLYKVDLDVDGRENTFQTMTMKTQLKRMPFDTNTRLYQTLEIEDIVNEGKATIRANENLFSAFTVSNKRSKNMYGNSKGYQILLNNIHEQVYPDNDIHTRQAEWSKYKLAITRYNSNESEAYCLENMLQQNNPPKCSFDSRFKDNETLIQQDLVAWLTIGGLRIPTEEKFPRLQTPGNSYSFFLQPFHYFNEDPSTVAVDAVYIDLDGNNTKISRQSKVNELSCKVPEKKFNFGKI